MSSWNTEIFKWALRGFHVSTLSICYFGMVISHSKLNSKRHPQQHSIVVKSYRNLSLGTIYRLCCSWQYDFVQITRATARCPHRALIGNATKDQVAMKPITRHVWLLALRKKRVVRLSLRFANAIVREITYRIWSCNAPGIRRKGLTGCGSINNRKLPEGLEGTSNFTA